MGAPCISHVSGSTMDSNRSCYIVNFVYILGGSGGWRRFVGVYMCCNLFRLIMYLVPIHSKSPAEFSLPTSKARFDKHFECTYISFFLDQFYAAPV